MHIHTIYQRNGLKPLISSNDSCGIEINSDFNNGDVSCVIGLIKSQTLSQFNESSLFNDMDWGAGNVDVSGEYFFMNSCTLSEANIQNSIGSTNKID